MGESDGINKTQPRRVVEASSSNVRNGDLYLSVDSPPIYDQMGIVAEMRNDGFFYCVHNHCDCDGKALRKYMGGNNQKTVQPRMHFLNTESGIFLRRQEDGRLEVVAATKTFLEEQEILDDLYQELYR